MQARVGLFRQFHRHGRRSVTRFSASDERVLVDGYELTVALARSRRVAPDGGFVFAVGGDEGRAFLEYGFQHGAVVDQHVSGGRAHEDLDAADPTRVGLEHFIEVVVGRTHEEGVVHGADFSGALVLVFEELLRQCLRDRVGHFHERGDASGRCCSGFGSDFPFVGQPGFPEVDLIVDGAWHQPKPLGINLNGLGCFGVLVAGCAHGADGAVTCNEHVADLDFSFVDNGCANETGRRGGHGSSFCWPGGWGGIAFGARPGRLPGRCSCSFCSYPIPDRQR